MKWEDPPFVSGVRGLSSAAERFAEEAAQLKARPGDWAVLAELPNAKAADSLATRIRRGEFLQLKGMEVTRRQRKIYIRWPGDQASEDPTH